MATAPKISSVECDLGSAAGALLGFGCPRIPQERAPGMRLISGCRAFQRHMKDRPELFHTIHDAYLDFRITVA